MSRVFSYLLFALSFALSFVSKARADWFVEPGIGFHYSDLRAVARTTGEIRHDLRGPESFLRGGWNDDEYLAGLEAHYFYGEARLRENSTAALVGESATGHLWSVGPMVGMRFGAQRVHAGLSFLGSLDLKNEARTQTFDKTFGVRAGVSTMRLAPIVLSLEGGWRTFGRFRDEAGEVEISGGAPRESVTGLTIFFGVSVPWGSDDFFHFYLSEPTVRVRRIRHPMGE